MVEKMKENDLIVEIIWTIFILRNNNVKNFNFVTFCWWYNVNELTNNEVKNTGLYIYKIYYNGHGVTIDQNFN